MALRNFAIAVGEKRDGTLECLAISRQPDDLLKVLDDPDIVDPAEFNVVGIVKNIHHVSFRRILEQPKIASNSPDGSDSESDEGTNQNEKA